MEAKKLDFRVNENGCFIATSHRLNKDGYCHFRFRGKDVRAHRLIFEECFGEIPKGLVVRHKCDVPSCVNPEHLELGTHKENMKDRDIRGRGAMGEKNGRSAIDSDQVRKIKKMLNSGITIREISKLYELSFTTVWRIKKSILWKHIAV